MPEIENRLALFVDFENLALGFYGTRKRFEIEKVMERLLTKGKILVKKAYADWTRFGDYRRELHEASIELIEIPKRSQVGKNSADIRLCVDALDLCYSKEHINSFCILSGDSDFSPLVSKLRENGKIVIGVGLKNSTSSLLVDGCDEFIYYEDIERTEGVKVPAAAPQAAGAPTDRKAEALQLVMDVIIALKREGKDVLWSSLVKDTLKRRKPQFDETYYGYKTWSDLLQDLAKRGYVTLNIDSKSGTYVITAVSEKPAPGGAPPPPPKVIHRESSNRERERREAAERQSRWAARKQEKPVGSAAEEAAPVVNGNGGASAPQEGVPVPRDMEASEADTAIIGGENQSTEPSEQDEVEPSAVTPVTEGSGEEGTPAVGAAPAKPGAPAKAGIRRRGKRGGRGRAPRTRAPRRD